MALADYSTSVEKIAALKCACMDPALAYIATADFVTDDVIFVIIGKTFKTDGHKIYPEETYGYTLRISNGSTISNLTGQASAIVYVKDSDIVYSNPIELYQSRLARIIETDKSYISNGSSFTAGTHGSLIVYGMYVMLQTGEYLDTGDGTETGRIVPIPSGQQIKTYPDASYTAGYFDVQSDW